MKIRGYDVLSSLGEGGMGEVWLCNEAMLNRQVAIKCLRPDHSGNQNFIARFEREGRILSRLVHPNIVQLYTLFEEDGNYFMVMEYAEGITLKALLENSGLLPEARAMGIFRQLADGLAYAHSKGVVHRDIKPANIMVDPANQDQVKIMDFGIARAKGDLHLTLTGETIGTILYMSPEQVLGAKDIDHRSDIYSAGVVLYEMLSGKIPYKVNPDSILMTPSHIVNDEIPDPREVYGAISQSTVDLLHGLTRKKPDDRVQDLRQLEAPKHESWAPPPPIPDPDGGGGSTQIDEELTQISPGYKSPNLAWLWILLAVVALGVGGLLLWRSFTGRMDGPNPDPVEEDWKDSVDRTDPIAVAEAWWRSWQEGDWDGVLLFGDATVPMDAYAELGLNGTPSKSEMNPIFRDVIGNFDCAIQTGSVDVKYETEDGLQYALVPCSISENHGDWENDYIPLLREGRYWKVVYGIPTEPGPAPDYPAADSLPMPIMGTNTEYTL